MERTAKVEYAIETTSQPFVGKWHELVSTTNWEKGRIICEWRDTLRQDDVEDADCTDEAWSRLAGGVTPQHVGRLRRVFERFGETHEEFPKLSWTHFYAALDWDDAEMWLEGGVQSKWSVSQMRRQRWKTLAGPPPAESDLATDTDEDFGDELPSEGEQGAATDGPKDNTWTPAAKGGSGPPAAGDSAVGSTAKLSSANEDGETAIDDSAASSEPGANIYADDENTITFVRPFENLAELPEDVAEAFDAFKLAILHHKTEGWQAISRDDLLASLDALKQLALAPSAPSEVE